MPLSAYLTPSLSQVGSPASYSGFRRNCAACHSLSAQKASLSNHVGSGTAESRTFQMSPLMSLYKMDAEISRLILRIQRGFEKYRRLSGPYFQGS